MKTFHYRIAGRTLEIRSSSTPSSDRLEILEPFTAAPCKSDYKLELKIHICPESVNPFAEAREWAMRDQGASFLADPIQASEKGWMAIVRGRADSCDLFTLRKYLGKAYLGALRLFLGSKISRENGGTYIHCAGIKIDDGAYLFLGPSGSGKTTLAMKARRKGMKILSDEFVFISRTEGSFITHGTPFGQISDGPLKGPVKRIFFLKHGAPLSFKPLSATKSTAEAWADSLFNHQVIVKGEHAMIIRNNVAENQNLGDIFSRWFDLFSAVPCYEMVCPLDFNDWEQITQRSQ